MWKTGCRCRGCTLQMRSPTARSNSACGVLASTGTRWLVESDVYPEKLAARDIAFVRPNAEIRNEINRIIMDELVNGVFKDASRAYVEAGDSAIPALDSTRLLARAALRRAL